MVILVFLGIGTIIGCLIVAENISKRIRGKESLSPEEAVISFYNKWKTEVDPMSEGFHTFDLDVSDNFKAFLSEFSEKYDPITCSDIFPAKYSIGLPTVNENSATINFSGSSKAVIGLKLIKNRWLIDSVTCEK